MSEASRASLPDELRVGRSLWRRPSALAVFGTAVAGTAVLLPIAPLAAMGFALLSIPASRYSMPRLHSLAAMIYFGRLEEAWESGRRLAVRERDPRWKAYLIGLLAMVETRRGRLDSALALFDEATAHAFPNRRVELSVTGSHAEALALAGEIERAESTLPEQAGPDFAIDWDRLVVWCRAGRYDEVLGYRAKLQRQLHRRFPAWAHHDNLLRAFAAQRAGRGEGEIDRYLRRVLKPYPTFYDYLGVRWREMREFLSEYGARIPVDRPPLPAANLQRIGRLGEPGALPAARALPPASSSEDPNRVDPKAPISEP